MGSNPINIDGVFGFIPFIGGGGNEQVNPSSLNTIVTGIFLFVLGIIVLVAGVIFAIIDRRREERRPPLTR